MTPSLPDPPPLLVGRERALGILRHHHQAALSGHGGLVLISGEAGIGKTALAEALCKEASEQGAIVLVGRCYDLSETPPYGPWIELFGRYQQRDGPPLPAAFAKRGTVGAVANQAVLFQQALDSFAALSQQCAVVLLFEDLHWADPASLDLLRVIVRQMANLHLLVVATYRSEEVRQQHALSALQPLLVREANAARLDLRPLPENTVRTWVADRYHLPMTDESRLVGHLRARGEGNALFIGELLRSLEETDVLRRADGGWTLGPLTESQVPPLLQQVIGARVSRLSGEAQRLLAVAAVIGQEMPYALWTTVAEVDEGTLLDVVTEAEAAHLMVETRDGSGATFVHALVREAVYESVRPSQRRRWHQRIGEVLAALPQPDLDAVASHFQRAGDARAVGWLVRAGEQAQAAYAIETAADRYQAACTLLAQTDAQAVERGWLLYRLAVLRRMDVPGTLAALGEAADIAAMHGDRALAASTAFVRAFTQIARVEYTVPLTDLVQAVDALEALTPEERARLNAADGVPVTDMSKPWRGSLVFILALVGHLDDAVVMGERFLTETAPPTTGGALRGFTYGGSYLGLAIAHALLGHPAQARIAFDQARAHSRSVGSYIHVSQSVQKDLSLAMLPYAADHIGERRALAQEAKQTLAYSYGSEYELLVGLNLTPLKLLEGEWDEAAALATRPGDIEYRPTRQLVNGLLGPVLHARGQWREAWARVDDSIPGGPAMPPGNLGIDHILPMQRLAARLALGEGETATAAEWLAAHDRWLAWSGAMLGQSEGEALWAQYHHQIGERETARAHAERALAHASEPRQPLALLAAHRLLGELTTEAGHFAEAATHLDASLALAEACAAPFERALTLLALAELKAVAGERSEATRPLDAVQAICERLGAQPTLARAASLAARLATSESSAPYPAGLSAREVGVLRLLASGSTNKEIAEALFLSERTIDPHVRNIFTKTRTDNRAAATAFAYQHNLA